VGGRFLTLGGAVRNAWCSTITFDDGHTSKDQASYSFGAASNPLYFAPVLSGVKVAAEVHHTDHNTYHAGVLWKLGGKLSLTPRAGIELDQELTKYNLGLTLDLVAMKLSGLYTTDSQGNRQFGAALTFGYEWGKG
jgi:hypothetical protein